MREGRRGVSSGEATSGQQAQRRRRARDGGEEEVRRRRSEGDRSGPLFMGGIPERVPFFPPTISTIVGGIYFVPRATWHYPERSIRPHRGPHSPNGSIPDRMRLPGAGTQATPCAEALECASAQTGRRVGHSSVSRIHREINGRDSLRWCYPVAGFASRLRQSRWEDLGKKISGKIDLGMEQKDDVIRSRKIVV